MEGDSRRALVVEGDLETNSVEGTSMGEVRSQRLILLTDDEICGVIIAHYHSTTTLISRIQELDRSMR